jgi:formamidopyrimidine-DNA glycosylase
VPELPEVETVVRVIRPRLIGHAIAESHLSIPRQSKPQTGRAISHAINGQSIREVRRRAKFILIELDNGTLLIHLGMTGRLYVRPTNEVEDTHERARFVLDGGRETLAFHDPRTFGRIRFFPAGTEITPIRNAGWEPLSETVTVEQLKAVLERRSIAIKPLLLNQSIWAGIGNIYASEILWESKIDPRKSASTLTRAEIERLNTAVPGVLRRALDKGGSTLRDFMSPEGKSGEYQKEFRVYGREGEPCLRCGKLIVRMVQAQRSTYFCKSCQKKR